MKNAEIADIFAQIADLLVTGGSDFHGPGKPDALLGRPRVPLAAMGEHWARRLLGPLDGLV